MKHLEFQTAPGLPVARVPVCVVCDAFHQSPSPDCKAPHGNADPREVLRQLCKVAGHAVTVAGRSVPKCLRCGRKREEVVS